MNKSEVIAAIADYLNVTRAEAARCLEAFLSVVKSAVAKGEEVSIQGFGKFYVMNRAPRVGRNPQTGEEIKISATKTLKFTPGKDTRAAVNG